MCFPRLSSPGFQVGGFATLTAMEGHQTDADDRPTPPITLQSITIYTDPFEELAEAERKDEADKDQAAKEE